MNNTNYILHLMLEGKLPSVYWDYDENCPAEISFFDGTHGISYDAGGASKHTRTSVYDALVNLGVGF